VHLQACTEALHAWEESEDDAELDLSPAVGPYCECEDCDRRELLAAYTPKLLQRLAADLHDAGHPEAARLVHVQSLRLDHPPLGASAAAALESGH